MQTANNPSRGKVPGEGLFLLLLVYMSIAVALPYWLAGGGLFVLFVLGGVVVVSPVSGVGAVFPGFVVVVVVVLESGVVVEE